MANPPDPFEFVRNLWAQMGVPGFSAPGAMPGTRPGGLPSFSPDELEKRVAELRQIRQWLEINLNMLNLQVNGLEMQLAALKSFKAAPGADFAEQAMRAAAGNPMFGQAPPAHAGATGFPFGMPSAPPPEPEPEPEPEPPPRAGDAKTAPWPDPTAWMQNLQTEFVKSMQALSPEAVAPKKATRKKAPARKTTTRAPAARRRGAA